MFLISTEIYHYHFSDYTLISLCSLCTSCISTHIYSLSTLRYLSCSSITTFQNRSIEQREMIGYNTMLNLDSTHSSYISTFSAIPKEDFRFSNVIVNKPMIEEVTDSLYKVILPPQKKVHTKYD